MRPTQCCWLGSVSGAERALRGSLQAAVSGPIVRCASPCIPTALPQIFALLPLTEIQAPIKLGADTTACTRSYILAATCLTCGCGKLDARTSTKFMMTGARTAEDGRTRRAGCSAQLQHDKFGIYKKCMVFHPEASWGGIALPATSEAQRTLSCSWHRRGQRLGRACARRRTITCVLAALGSRVFWPSSLQRRLPRLVGPAA